MKKLTGIIAGLIIIFSASSFKTPIKNVSSVVLTSFNQSFASVTDVTWEEQEGFYFANFKLNGITSGAAFNSDGDLVATSRKLNLSQLPLNVSLAINKNYSTYTIAPVITEITLEGSTSYYFTAKNQKFTVTVKADPVGSMSVEKKMRNKKALL